MKAEGFNWYGESSEDEDDEQIVAKQEKTPLDLASLLKGETSDQKDSSTKSIGEIFGISKPEDAENSEPSTFDKIIDRSLEEDIGESSTAQAESQTVGVEAEPGSEDLAVSLNTREAEDFPSEDEDLTPSDAVASKTVYSGGHEYPLADLSAADIEQSSGSGEPDERQPDSQDQEVGRAEEISDGEASVPEAEPEPELARETVPIDQPAPIEAEATSTPESEEERQPGAASSPESAPAEPEPEAARSEAADRAQPEDDEASTPQPDTAEPELTPEAEPIEAAAEADARAKQIAEADGSKDQEPPSHRHSGVGEAEEPEPIRNLRETIPETEKGQSPMGTLALLLGVREIFKRRKGDKENKEALEEHERLEELKRQDLEAAQERIDRELDQVRMAPTKPEDIIGNAQDEILEPDINAHVYSNEYHQNFNIDQTKADNLVDASQALKHETIGGTADDFSINEPESDIEGSKEKILEKSEAYQEAEQIRKWNQEIGGEFVFDSRHEASSINKISNDFSQNSEQSGKPPVHISDVIAGSEYVKPADSQSSDDHYINHKEYISDSGHEAWRTSIKAGVTVGLIIATLGAIFLLFR